MRHSLGLGPRREDNYPGRLGNKKRHRQPRLPQSPDTWNQFHKARKVSEKASFLRKDGKGKLFFVLTQIFLHYFSCQIAIIQPGFYRVDILSSLSPMARLIKDDHSNLIGLAGVLPRSWLICSASTSQSTLLLCGRWILAENRISGGSQVLLPASGYNGFQLRHYAWHGSTNPNRAMYLIRDSANGDGWHRVHPAAIHANAALYINEKHRMTVPWPFSTDP